MFGSASGSIDANFNVNWLVDGRPGRPAKLTGNPSWTATFTAVSGFDCLAVCNHTIDAGKAITVSGGVSGTITVGTLPPDGIPLNPFTTFTPASVSTVTVAWTGNSVASVVGELYGGKRRTLQRHIRLGAALGQQPRHEWGGEFMSLPPYDLGLEARTLAGDTVVDGNGLAEIDAWYQSTRRGTRPTLIIPDDSKNDAWLVVFTYTVEVLKKPTAAAAQLYRVDFQFQELPRTRW